MSEPAEPITGALTPSAQLAHLRAATHAFAAVLDTADLDRPIAACPGWTLRDLAAHLGGVHRWAAHAVRENTPGDDAQTGPGERSALVQWYRDAAGDLVSLLEGTDPGAPCWTFGPPPRLAGFWFRRQAQETTIHLWDASAASGTPELIPTELALDGLDEIVRVIFPRQVRLQRCPPLSQSLGVVATDGGRRGGSPSLVPGGWLIAGDGLPADRSWGGDGDMVGSPVADAVVRGPAQAVLLALWKRIDLHDAQLSVHNPAVAAAILATALAP